MVLTKIVGILSDCLDILSSFLFLKIENNNNFYIQYDKSYIFKICKIYDSKFF